MSVAVEGVSSIELFSWLMHDPSAHQKFQSMETSSGIAPVFTEIHDNSLVDLISITKSQGHNFRNSLTPDIFDTTWFRLHGLLCYNTHEIVN